MTIEFERVARLFKLLRRARESGREPSLDEIRACATRLTNPEICGILAVISGEIPPSRDLYAEYMRAFAHSIEFEQVYEILGRGPNAEGIPLGDVESFYQMHGGQGGWGWLDEDERQWIRDFNQKVKEAHDAEKVNAGRSQTKTKT